MSEPAFAQPTIYAGAKAPEAVVATILPGASELDLSTVTQVDFQVDSKVGPQVVWSTTIVQKRSDKLVAKHVFDVNGVEVRLPGVYRLLPILTLANNGGVVRAKPFYLAVSP